MCVEIPWELRSDDGSNDVWELMRALYGLRAESMMFIHRGLNLEVIMHVGDPPASGSLENVRRFYEDLNRHTPVRVTPPWGEEPQVFLGARYRNVENTIGEAGKEGYTENVLDIMDTSTGNPVSTENVRQETKRPEDEQYISEYYGARAAAAECMYGRTIVESWEHTPGIELQIDASSDIAVGSRHSTSRVSHGEPKYSWPQQMAATKHVRLPKVKETEHPPDMVTKHLSRKALATCIEMVGPKRLDEIDIALVGNASKPTRVRPATLLPAAGGTAQEVGAPAVSPAAASLADERQPRSAEGLLLSSALVSAGTKGLDYASRPRARTCVDEGTETPFEKIGPSGRLEWITPWVGTYIRGELIYDDEFGNHP